MRIADYIEQLIRRLQKAEVSFGHGTDNATDEAFYLVLGSLKIPFEGDNEMLQRDLGEDELLLLESLVERRINDNIPTAYLLEEAWFAGHRFKIDNRALVPRSPIAELIGNRFQPLLKSTPTRILDLCTGSGCIGIACALEFPDATVDLVDISIAGLQLAQENINRYALQQRVHTLESDLFDNVSQTYELIVCNPPYVSAEEIVALPKEYQHEPALGLFSEDQGLALVLKILRQASSYLSQPGMLIMEVGHSHHALTERLPQVPLLWLEFEKGGEGVFMLSGSQLLKYRGCFI